MLGKCVLMFVCKRKITSLTIDIALETLSSWFYIEHLTHPLMMEFASLEPLQTH